MQRQALMALAATLTFGSAGALAQGSLAGVTMRVLDDLSDIDAVVLELDANRAAGDESSATDGPEAAPAEEAGDTAPAEPTERELGDDTDELHHVDDDERSEGRLEDRDVERPAASQPPAP